MRFAQILVAPSTPLDCHVFVETTSGALVVFAKAVNEDIEEDREVRCIHHVRSNADTGGGDASL